MYILKIRKASDIVQYFKERDKNSIISDDILYFLGKTKRDYMVRVGRNFLFNLDEVLSALQSESPI